MAGIGFWGAYDGRRFQLGADTIYGVRRDRIRTPRIRSQDGGSSGPQTKFRKRSMNSLITGFIVAIITFPGVVVRQLVRQLLCYYYGIPVFRVSYFRLWPPGGVVVHEPPSSPWIGMILIMGPAVVNTLLGLAIRAPAVFGLLTNDNTPFASLRDFFLIWLGVSVAVHSFPNLKDAEEINNSMSSARHPAWVRSMGTFFSVFSYFAAIGSIVWLDVIYAVIVVIGIPIIFFEVLRFTF